MIALWAVITINFGDSTTVSIFLCTPNTTSSMKLKSQSFNNSNYIIADDAQ